MSMAASPAAGGIEHDRVWICRRLDIANHWIATHPYRAS